MYFGESLQHVGGWIHHGHVFMNKKIQNGGHEGLALFGRFAWMRMAERNKKTSLRRKERQGRS
jgi:hypothetical protein